MNNLDKTYTDLLQDILDNGVEKKDRTGTGTLSVFGRQIRHKMSEGFPLLTTKKMHWKSIVVELLWFLRGDTNIKFLHDNNCHIWDGDYAKSGRTDGELGPIYGKQWRSWGGKKITSINLEKVKPYRWGMIMDMVKNGDDVSEYGVTTETKDNSIDQIANSINLLKTDPDSRRNKVSAWNVGELEEMTLPPCHTDFQFYTRELSLKERTEYKKKRDSIARTFAPHTHQMLDNSNIPTRAISLMFNMRSNDVPLGLPFNIASYGLVLEIFGKMVNMVPDELIGNLGDTHIYLNQIDGIKEQMTRTSFELPSLIISDDVNFDSTIDDFLDSCTKDSFKLDNYKSHPSIKIPLSN